MIKGISKKFISIVTVFAMVINLMPAFTLTAHAASVAGTLTFSGPDTGGDMPPMAPIVNDGISYWTSYGSVSSPDIPNIQLDIFGAASVDNAKNNIVSGNMYYYKDTLSNIDGIGNNDETNGKVIVIKSNDRTGFSFQSVQMNDTTATSLKIEGFRDGSLIDYDMLNLSGVHNDTFSWGSGLTQSKFQNVDEVRIINPNGNTLSELLINNIKIGDPVIPNTIPKVSSVSIDGTTQVGQTLTGKYTFTDPDPGATDKSTYQWYRAKSVTGEGAVAISGATSKNYTLTTFDTDKDSDSDEIYIGLKVTPNDGTSSGTAVTTTTYVGPITTSSIQNNYIVTNTNDSGTGSLRWAIQQAGLYGNGNITFDSSLKGSTITLTSDLTTWDTSNDIFDKPRYSGAQLNDFSGNFTLTGLTDDSGTPAITINGGGHIGIWATGSGTFNIINVKFTNFTLNSTDGTYEGFGAAVATGGQYAQVNLSNVIFDSNAAHTNINAGIASLSANAEPWEVNVDRCVFSNNTISEADSNISNTPIAGALYINTANKLKLTNSLFASNTVSTNTVSTVYGGAAFVSNGGADVLNCTFYKNKLTNADSGGSAKGAALGVYGSETVPFNLYNNIMIGNTANGSDSTYFTNNGTGSNAAFKQNNNLLTGTASNIFTDAASGKFTLSSTATDAIDKGNNTYTFGSYDLAGNNRIINSTVDLGAYEYKAPPSTDASLKSSSTVKGQTVTSLGTPNETLGLVTAGSVTITASQAVNTSNTGSFITLFDMNESHSAVKVVRYAAGATPDTTTFNSASAYANEAITDGDFFIVKVTAQDGTTINYYKINVTVTPAGNYTATASASTSTPVVGADNEITLTVKNSAGNTDTNFNGDKTVTITGYEAAQNNTYGSFNGTTLEADGSTDVTVSFAAGVAKPKLKLNKADGQTIGFSIGTVTSPATNTITITPSHGNASSMAVTQNITAPAVNGGNFAQQPVITINDAYGNICTNDSSTEVTVAKKDAGTWTLTGTTTTKAILGVVTFTNLGATNTALVNNAQLGFTSGSMTEVTSAAVTLPAPAGNCTATASASTLNPVVGVDNEITLTVKDSLGNTDTGFNGTKNVTITGVETAPNGSYGSFNGIDLNATSVVSGQVVSVTFTDGVAKPKLNLNKADGQTIVFSIGTVTTPATNTLTITPIHGNASSMALTQNITAPAVNGGNFAQQPVLILKDAYGNICTNDSSTEVTVAKKDAGTWTLTGTTTAKAILGVVTFANLGATNTALVNNAQLGFTSGSMTEVTSAAVTLPAPAGNCTAAASASTLTPSAGADNEITLTVKDSLGNTDTNFDGAIDVTINGVEAAPDGSYGNFNGTALDASSVVSGQVVSVTFTDGVAKPKLNLNKAAGQTIGFSIGTVTTPATNTLNITPTNGSASSMTVTRDITAPAVNGGSFAQQPIVTLKDAYGNMCTSDNSTVVTAAKKDTGTWTLTGTKTATSVLGVVTFTNLGATNTALVNNAQLGFTSGSMTEVTSAAVTLPAPAPSGGGTGGTDTPTPISVDTTVTGAVVDSTTGEVVKGVPATVTTFSDGTKTIAVKSQDAILFKGTSSTNGTNGTINDFTKLNFSTPETTGTSEGTKAPSVDIKPDGTIQVQNLRNGLETKFNVTLDLGNGKKITIGSICVKMSQTGDASLTSTLIDPYGIVTDEDTGKIIDGAHVVLYYADTDRNKANGKTPDTLVELPEISGFKPNDNANPQESDSLGAYGFMVFPTTDYYLVATKDGYNKYTSPTISVEQEIVKWDFKMTKLNLTNPVITLIGDKEVTVKQHETYTDAGVTAKDSNGIDITKNIVTSNTVDTNKAGDYTITYNVTDRSGNKAAEVTRIVHVVSIGKPIITLLGNAEVNIKQHDTYTDAGATAVDALGTDITNRIEITNSVDTNKMGDYKVTYNVKDKDGNIADTVTRIVHVIGVARIAGDTRVDTAIEIAKASYPHKLSNVILATADNYPDALAGGPLAYKLNAPILLVGSSDEDQQKVLDYMKEYVDQSGTVYILGGRYVLSPEMENKVASNGFKNINRIAGEDRYETAAKIADVLNEGSGKPVILVTGENYPDALSISSVAAANQYTILFVETNNIPECTKNKLEQLKPSKIYIVGLHQVVTPEVESEAAEISGLDKSNVIRIGGEDRYETSLAVAKYFNLNSGNICIATGNNFPDAITGSVYAAENNSPIILVDNDLTDSQKQYFQSQKLSKVIIFGGKYVVSEEIEQQINQVMDKYIK